MKIHYGCQGRREKRMIVSNIKILHICIGRGHNRMYCRLPNNGNWEEGVRDSSRRD
jgi:hypothetical protein